ncbi:anthranilate synthase component II [Clostridium cylindrosporum]|uniref:Bifunctional protein TrpGD n=1 Tax=Clostridium cylindrosporum DSM 605 TaxID=1121307 RepID=A0A0J8D9F4_CLOCY|nr:aminodeoxychorismate/anthranilate synthase component II [Clostridium cylindrosporum]KMT20923.1 bifunctional protein TrpGD [Clostridium cylindrosporum DSM 605]
MILIIDNFDSFTYNVYQYIGNLYKDIKIYRNNEITIDEIKMLNPRGIIISPGPKTPKDAGISMDVIKEFYKTTPILGICLGHQAIGEVFGGEVIRAEKIMHGKTSNINHDGKGLFTGINKPLRVMRYHSLVISKDSTLDEFEVTAKSEDDDEIMGICHKKYPLHGVQFHPESIFTEDGMKIIENFINLIR